MDSIRTDSPGDRFQVGILVFMASAPQSWAESIRTLLSVVPTDRIRIACHDLRAATKAYAGLGVALVDEWTISSAVGNFLKSAPELDAVLVVTSPVSAPASLLERANLWMRDDPRVASVSFLSNAAGYLSFPYRNTANFHSISGYDESSLTRRLRDTAPDSGPVPIAVPAGSAILFNRMVMAAVGGLDPAFDDQTKDSLAEYALRCSRRGFQHLLDASSFVTAQWTEDGSAVEPGDDPTARHRLYVQDSSFPALYDAQKESLRSPLAIALDSSRCKVDGLRVLIDGSCLGPMEMGTQVQTLALIEALAKRADVKTVVVGLPPGGIPGYARKLMSMPKVKFCASEGLAFPDAEPVDILHRPFQPDGRIPWERWRGLSKRVVVTVQDLIAYRVGIYHANGGAWLGYRQNMFDAVSNADAVIAISEDTARSICEEKLNISSDRVFVVKNGSDHLHADSAAEATPMGLVERGMAATPYLLVLGATYAHKNRDLAIKVWQALRERGHRLALVMAGAIVAKGSSKVEEAMARRAGDDLLVVMPDVSSEEKNWLLRHAAMVLYPTSAEGFGLVPFEAARMGTPTVHVNFGPLRELIDSPDMPKDWSIQSLADYAERVLVDPASGRKMIQTVLNNAGNLTWEVTASGLVDAYRAVLGEVPRH